MIAARSLLSNLLGSLRRPPNTFLQVTLTAFVFLGPALTRAPKPVQDVSRATLDNGLRVVIVHSSLAPVVTTVVNYLVGSNEAPRGFPGTAHAVEHMMFRGSPDLSSDQLANIAAAMGGDFNADTQQSVTRFFFTVPKQDLDVALHIESIRMRNLLFSDVLWDQERGAIEQEVAGDLSNPEYVLYTKLLSEMFRGSPYEHDALGTRPSFNATTGAILKKFHETWYAPNNAILVIAGDVDPATTMAEVKDLFAAIPTKTLPARPQVQLAPVKPETLHLTTDLSYGLAVVAFRWPGSNSPDFAAAQVLADVLGSQRSSLYNLVPQGKALSAGFSFDSLPQASLGYAQAAFPAGKDGTALLSQVREVLEDIAKNGVPADLVNAAKRHEVADAEFQKNSILRLAMLWSEALALEGRHSPNDDIEAIHKVTLEDVRAMARRLLNRLNVVVGRTPSFQRQGIRPTQSEVRYGILLELRVSDLVALRRADQIRRDSVLGNVFKDRANLPEERRTIPAGWKRSLCVSQTGFGQAIQRKPSAQCFAFRHEIVEAAALAAEYVSQNMRSCEVGTARARPTECRHRKPV